MLEIRKRQVEDFELYMLNHFQDRMVADLKDFFPESHKELGEVSIRERIEKGVNTAAQYGIENEYDVARYIVLMFYLSEEFDTDPEYYGLREILLKKDLDSTSKMDALFENAINQTK